MFVSASKLGHFLSFRFGVSELTFERQRSDLKILEFLNLKKDENQENFYRVSRRIIICYLTKKTALHFMGIGFLVF